MSGFESESGETPGRVDEFSQRACEQLAILIRCLVEALHKFQHVEADVLSNSEEAHHLLEELKAQLHQARNLVDRSYAMPWMYRIINAFQIRSEFRNVCHSLGLTLEGLHSLLSSEIDELKDELKQLEWAFRNAMFPLDSVELQVFKEARNISSEIYKTSVSLSQGIAKLRKMLESTFGPDKVQGQWKQVAEHLYRDMDAARIKKDRMEEHYLRQLLWAVSGSDAPPEFYCPISLNIMEEPVVLFQTAVTYDRKSLETWLFAYGSKKCPVSGRALTDTAFVENRPLRSLIEEWKRTQTFGGSDGNEDLLQSASSRDITRHWGSHVQSAVGSPPKHFSHPPPSPTAESEDPMAFLESTIDDYRAEYPHHAISPYQHSLDLDSYGSTGSGSVTRRRLKEKGIMIELMAASEEGDMRIIQELGESGWDLSHCDEGGRSCLHLASAYGHEDIVAYLLTKGLNIHATTPNDNASPLYLAALGGHVGAVQVLLSYGANISGVNKNGWTALHAAADQGHGEVAKVLLLHARKANLPCSLLQSVSGWTALHHAARCGGINTTMQMLHFYDDVNLKCEAGWTPLHVAVDNGHRDIVKLLLTSTNANPNIQSKDGWTSLHAAQDKNYLEIGRILLKYGSDADIQSAEGVTALHRAAFLNHLEFSQLIVSEGKADLNKKTKAGRKAIQIASELGHHEIYNFLFRKGLRRMFKSRN